ncbi:MAG: CoA ester lyase, partial [Bacillota bacterium]|nr:CoA ester lyase [Bacillota bacterium]
MPIRTFLFAPGSNLKVMTKAIQSEADAVILDLEDSVVMAEKAVAREQVANFIKEDIAPENKIKVYVRINSLDTDFCYDDVKILTCPKLTGFFLPKAESAEDISRVDLLIAAVEEAQGISKGQLDLIPIVESAEGVVRAQEIAIASKRVSRLAFGALDYALDLGISISDTGEELIYPRSMLAIAAKVAGKKPPVDCVYANIKNTAGFNMDVGRGKQQGAFGKMIIHPSQIQAVHEAYSPTDT